MKRIAVLTSGGDASGMNAAIRAVVRSGVNSGYEVHGVRDGFAGLIRGDFMPLGIRDVGGIIGRGGTILGTSRCPELKTDAGQAAAVQQLMSRENSGLIVIGGSGSQIGAFELSRRGVAVVGIASTIDNDLDGSDTTIGATTALDVAVEAIDRLRVTAAAHKRVFLVEVMGRDTGHLALIAGVAGGAEAIVVPEIPVHPEAVADQVRAAYSRGKSHAIIIVAEGAQYNADGMARYFTEHSQRLGFEVRTTVLGHIQRGGTPGVFDRMIATRLGVAAVRRFACGEHGVLLGIIDGKVSATPLASIARVKKPLDRDLLAIAEILAT